MKELETNIVKFAEERDWLQFNTPENLAKSIAIEAGELLECFQWNNNYDKDELKQEIADVMNYCIQMSQVLNVDIIDIINAIDSNKTTLFFVNGLLDIVFGVSNLNCILLPFKDIFS